MQIQKAGDMSQRSLGRFIVLVFIIFIGTSIIVGQTKTVYPRKITVAAGFKSKIEGQSEIIKPADFSPGKKYPLLIFLPFTGGDSKSYFNFYANELSQFGSYIVMLTPEPTSTIEHSWQGFEAATYRYEARIMQDLKSLYNQKIIDTTKVILVGYSMGGDMSWAITQRHPELFRGAIISGSRTSWSEKNGIAQIKKYGLKYFFVMGSEESVTRLNGLNATLGLLSKNKILYKFERTPGGHVPSDAKLFGSGLQFIFN